MDRPNHAARFHSSTAELAELVDAVQRHSAPLRQLRADALNDVGRVGPSAARAAQSLGSHLDFWDAVLDLARAQIAAASGIEPAPIRSADEA